MMQQQAQMGQQAELQAMKEENANYREELKTGLTE
jgi:hypothetical protein